MPQKTPPENDDLDQLLASLKLPRIREIIEREVDAATKSQPSYSAFLARLLREKYQDRQRRSVEYRIKQARLPERWSLETYPFKRQSSVRASTMRQLAELDFVARAANLVFIGETGVGKTGLASSLLLKAMENGYRGFFVKAQDLFDEVYMSMPAIEIPTHQEIVQAPERAHLAMLRTAAIFATHGLALEHPELGSDFPSENIGDTLTLLVATLLHGRLDELTQLLDWYEEALQHLLNPQRQRQHDLPF